jgi:DNA polymerase-3 subunit gamma/tau
VSAEVWYRKWRPKSFSEVAGQEHVTRTLANAVAQGRVSHAYLLCGPRGTGKTTTARLLAKAVNCARPTQGEPCNACESCRAVNDGRALDLIEMDAASNRGIDDIRSLRDKVGYHPTTGRYRVYLIDEVHELTAQAFDALLKTLEEPPAHVIFVLATTDAHRVPATIVSRCQRFDLARARTTDVAARLRFIAEQERVHAEDGVYEVVARAATGSFRDAVNLLEQLVASYGASLTEAQAREGLGMIADGRAADLARYAAEGNFAAGLDVIAAVHDDGIEMRQFNRAVIAELRALLLVKANADAGLEGYSAESLAALHRIADGLDSRRILRALKAFSAADFRGEALPTLPLELALAECTLLAETEPSPERAPVMMPTGAVPARIGPPPPQPAEPAVVSPVAEERVVSTAAARAPEQSVAEPAGAPENGAVPDTVGRVAGPITLDSARAAFRELYNVCKQADVKTGGFLNSGCDIVAVDGSSITFGFRHEWLTEKFLPGTLSHRVLSGAVERVLGKRLEVRCTHVPNVEERLRANPPRASHLVDEARKLGLRPIERS